MLAVPADLNTGGVPHRPIEARDARGATCVLRAAGVGCLGMLKCLVEVRPDVHATHASTRRDAHDGGNHEVRDCLKRYHGVRGTGQQGQKGGVLVFRSFKGSGAWVLREIEGCRIGRCLQHERLLFVFLFISLRVHVPK